MELRYKLGLFKRELTFFFFGRSVRFSSDGMEETDVLCCPCMRDFCFPDFIRWLIGVMEEK